jgi:uncharacterized protein
MSSPQHEPTMEEILASIRKIISEDAPEAVPAVEAPSASPVEAAAKQELLTTPDEEAPEIEVLELTQEVYEAPPEPVAAQEAPVADDVIFETAQSAAAPARDNGIFSDQTRRAMDDTFASIADQPETAPAPRPAPAPLAPIGAATVENVFERAVRESFEPVMAKYLSDNSAAVIDRMKPLIREWMDEHFPALLEGAVRTEIERVVKARGKR